MTKKHRLLLFAAGFVSLACLLPLLTGCEIDSAETGAREVGIIVAGYYANGGNPIIGKNTGAPITALDLRQSGDQLEGVDNNGYIFKGTIGSVNGDMAGITLRGLTTAGQEGTISGTIQSAGGTGTMKGTWIEPSLYSTVYALASVPTNSGGGAGRYTLTVKANPTAGGSVSGGGSYNAGSSATITATANSGYTFGSWSGDASGSSASTTITMNGNKSVTANFNSGGGA